MKTEISDNGIVQVSTGDSSWTANSPEQAEKHLPTWTNAQRDGRASPVIDAGDVRAIRDCADDARKQTAAHGRYRPTESWRYVNGEAIATIRDGELVADAPEKIADARARSFLDFVV
jgi:hypothetical protein